MIFYQELGMNEKKATKANAYLFCHNAMENSFLLVNLDNFFSFVNYTNHNNNVNVNDGDYEALQLRLYFRPHVSVRKYQKQKLTSTSSLIYKLMTVNAKNRIVQKST